MRYGKMDYSIRNINITDITQRCVKTICQTPEVQSLTASLVRNLPLYDRSRLSDEHSVWLSPRPPRMNTFVSEIMEDTTAESVPTDVPVDDQEQPYDAEEAMWDEKIKNIDTEIAEIKEGTSTMEELISTCLHIRDNQLIKGSQVQLRDMFDTLYDPSPEVCNKYMALTGRDMSLYNQDISDIILWSLMNDGKKGMFEETIVYDPAEVTDGKDQAHGKTLKDFVKILALNIDTSKRLNRGYFWHVRTHPRHTPEQEEKVRAWVWQKLEATKIKTPTLSFWEHRRKKGIIVVFIDIAPPAPFVSVQQRNSHGIR